MLRRLNAVESRIDGLLPFLRDELAPHPGRLHSTIRMAVIAAVGAGLMAAMRVDTELGLYLIWSIVSAPAGMMRPFRGAILILATGIGLALSVPLAGVLVEAPWMLIACFASVTALSTYLLTDAQLTNGWRMVQIFGLTSFWVVVFDPASLGWSAAYAFAAAVVGFSLIVLFDNVFWPDPADRKLLRLLDAGAERTRARLRAVRHAYLDPAGSAPLPRSVVVGTMSAQLALLSRAEGEGLSALRHARLLAAVSVSERMRIEVERLLALAGEPVPHRLREIYRPQLTAILDAIDAALVIDARLLSEGLEQDEEAMPDAAGPIYSMIEAYNQRVAELHPHFAADVRADELSNLSAFALGLERIARLFIHTPIPLAAAPHRARGAAERPREWLAIGVARDPAHVRYCLKLAAALALAFVVGVTTHRADLTTLLWTVMITGLPTYGASMRKMILRFVGAALGGVLALAAIIVVSPNFETVLTYMLVFFIALVPCAYLGLSGGRMGYPGKQAGVTFCLLFTGLAPSLREYEALWRLWGVLLGVVVVAIVFIVLWPEYAGDAMVPRLEKMLEMILALMPHGESAPDEHRIESLEIECSKTLGQLLAVADDARIEGGRSGFDPDAMVNAIGTLRRIAHRLGSVAAGRNLRERPALPPYLQSARDAIDARLRAHLEACLAYVKSRAADAGALREWDEQQANALLGNLHRQVAADSFSAIASWPIPMRRALLAEIEAYRRLTVLCGELADQLSRIALSRPAAARRLEPRAVTA